MWARAARASRARVTHAQAGCLAGAEARYFHGGAGGALAPLAGLVAISFADRDAALEHLAGHGRRHFVCRNTAFVGAARIELAALHVVLLDAPAQISGDVGARDEAQKAVGLFADEAAGTRLRNHRVGLLRHRRRCKRQRGGERSKCKDAFHCDGPPNRLSLCSSSSAASPSSRTTTSWRMLTLRLISIGSSGAWICT